MSDLYVLDEHGQARAEPDLITWGRWFQQASKPISEGDRMSGRHVAVSVRGDVCVSTVFLGMDHGFSPENTEPVLWETLVIGGPLEGEMDRYTNRTDAEVGHAAMVERVEKALEP